MKVLGWMLIGSWIIYNIFMLKIFGIPLMIAKDPWLGSGYTIGCIGYLALGIWLVCKKRK